MCLQSAGVDDVATPGMLECLTLMPFGSHYDEREASRPLFFPDLYPLDPDQGLTIAIGSLGWACNRWMTEKQGAAEEAIAQLRTAIQQGPVLIGPLDMGYLSHNPRAGGASDHFVVALELDEHHAVVHDPYGFPFARLPIKDLLQAWRATRIDYASGAFIMRFGFRRVEQRSWVHVTSCSIAALREILSAPPRSPTEYGGPSALLRVADLLRTDNPPSTLCELQYFALPLGARRCLDGADFLRSAGLVQASSIMTRKAVLYGRAQYDAVHKNWAAVANVFTELAAAEAEFVATLLS